MAAEEEDALVFVGVQKEFVAASAGFDDLDGWKDPHFGDGAVEVELHVAGAFELLEDEVVHAAFGFDEGGAEDGEAAAFFGVACGSKEFAGLGERFGIDAAAHRAPLARLEIVVSSSHAGDGIEENDDVASEFDKPLGPVGNALADLNMAGHRLIKSGRVNLAIECAAHIGDLLWALVHKKKYKGCFGMIDANTSGECLEENCFSCAGGSSDESTLTHPERGYEIYSARCNLGITGSFQKDTAIWKKRCQFVKLQGRLPLGRGNVLDG